MEPKGPFLSAGYAFGTLFTGGALLVGVWVFGPSLGWVLLGLNVAVIGGGVAFLVALFVVGRYRERDYHRRVAEGRCNGCGYDLRGAAQDTCPKCGMPVWRPRDPLTGRVIGGPEGVSAGGRSEGGVSQARRRADSAR